jgi:hypothetical protein
MDQCLGMGSFLVHYLRNLHVYGKRALEMKCVSYFCVTLYEILFALINLFIEICERIKLGMPAEVCVDLSVKHGYPTRGRRPHV